MRIAPSTNSGSAMNTSSTTWSAVSTREPRSRAETVPIRSEPSTSRASAIDARIAVLASAGPMSSLTGAPVPPDSVNDPTPCVSDVPKSPCTTPPSHWP